MKKNKTAELFLVLLILIVMSAGILILQNGMEKLQSVEQESVYVPETRDLYNNYGLKNDQSLSTTKILETQDQRWCRVEYWYYRTYSIYNRTALYCPDNE